MRNENHLQCVLTLKKKEIYEKIYNYIKNGDNKDNTLNPVFVMNKNEK